MIYLFAILALSTAASADSITRFERYYTISPRNDYYWTENRSEITQDAVIKKTIDQASPWTISVKITNLKTGKQLWSGTDLNICKEYRKKTWEFAMTTAFRGMVLPTTTFLHSPLHCPYNAQTFNIYRYAPMTFNVPGNPSGASFEASITAKAKSGETIFDPVRIRFRTDKGDFTPYFGEY